MRKTRVSIEKVVEMKKFRLHVNRLELSNIIWTKNGRDVPVDEETVRDFAYTGLCNTDFISMNGDFVKLNRK